MQMTDDEIRSSMRRAKRPAEQVKVLAELNACSETEIRAKLEELGIAAPAKKPKVWKFDTDRARQLLAEGRTDLEAAEMLGISKQTFGDWRRAMKIPVNPEPRRQAKAKRAMPGPAVPASGEPGDPDDDRDHLSQYFVLPETVGEWTGYYDSHSRRIYEGDLVRFERAIYRVELWQRCWCLRPL